MQQSQTRIDQNVHSGSSEGSGILTLDTIPIGGICVVESLHNEAGFASRLLELGITKGTSIQIRGKAPLGDPIMITARGCQFAIRKKDAREIGVIPA
jgi:ferrous iron transport protein A